MFDSQNGGGTGLVTAYATFEGGAQPQSDETVMYHRMRGAMKDRLAEQEAARPAGEADKLARRMAGDKKALLEQMQRKPEKAREAGQGEEKVAGPEGEERAATDGREQRGFWRRLWCFT